MTTERVDLADLTSVAAFGERMRGRYDHLDVLVNNAGVVMPLDREVAEAPRAARLWDVSEALTTVRFPAD